MRKPGYLRDFGEITFWYLQIEKKKFNDIPFMTLCNKVLKIGTLFGRLLWSSISYVVMSVCVFSIILTINERRGLVADFHSLSRKNPILAVSLALVFLSIAGVPPLTGFLSKWFILWAGVSNGYYLICVVAVLSSVVAGVYYVRIVQMTYADFHGDLGREGTIDLKRSVLIGSTLYLVLFILICPSFLLQVTYDAAIGLWVHV